MELHDVIHYPYYQYPVRVHDCVEAMSNSHNRTIREVLSYSLLNNLIRPFSVCISACIHMSEIIR